MKTKYRIDRWNDQVKKWLWVDSSEDELWAVTALEDLRKTYPNDTYRLVKVTTNEEVVA
jgi:hypothetical protein